MTKTENPKAGADKEELRQCVRDLAKAQSKGWDHVRNAARNLIDAVAYASVGDMGPAEEYFEKAWSCMTWARDSFLEDRIESDRSQDAAENERDRSGTAASDMENSNE